MEWTREKTLALIAEYRKRRGLWDMTHDDYRKKEMKAKLLLEVSNNLGGGVPILEIEKKFHTLRTQYHRELNRIKRKNPYNSKWFGFKNLQFLSSPNACRANNKGRVKEITEDGTVTTKYVLRDTIGRNAGSANSSNETSDEYLTIRKPTTITYETMQLNNNVSVTSRSHELEKLIEETTKDVDIEEVKPKTIDATGNYSNAAHITNEEEQLTVISDAAAIGTKIDEEHIEAIDMQTQAADEAEISYQTGTSANQQEATRHYIKIRRDSAEHLSEFYDDPQPQQATPHIHTILANGKRTIYYESPSNNTATTVLSAAATSIANATPVVHMSTNNTKIHHQTTIKPITTRSTNIQQQQQQQQLLQQTVTPTQPQHPSSQQQLHKSHTEETLGSARQQQQQLQQQPIPRDEFATYGEYVANEMRGISNREILTALKHKINTALFEASMAELKN